MKKFFIILIFLLAHNLYAEDRFSAGLTAGYQHDVGMLAEKNIIRGSVQNNLSIGMIIKLDLSIVFVRSGAEYSYPVKKSVIADSSAGDIEGTALSFVEAPLYFGINLPLRDFGSVFIGGGGSYIFGMGRVNSASGDVDVSEQLFGYGIIAGTEYEIYGNASFIFEWEYMAARSSPLASTGGGADDFYADYSGQRLRFGAVYHFNK